MPERIISEFADISKRSDIISIDYNPKLLNGNSNSNNDSSLVASIDRLEKVAQRTQNDAIISLAKSVKKRTEEVLDQNLDLEKKAAQQAEELRRTTVEKNARKKQVFFLQGQVNNTSQNLINGMHSIYTNTETTRVYIDNIKEILDGINFPQKEILIEYLSEVEKANKKANKISEMAINGNQSLKQTAPESLYEFIAQYIKTSMVIPGLSYKLQDSDKPFECVFNPISIGIILDNIASNSIKARANNLTIALREDTSFVYISFQI